MNKASVIKRTREHKDKSYYDLLQDKIVTEEEYNWLVSQQSEQAELPTVSEKKGKPKAELKTVSQIKAEKAAETPQAKPVTVRRIDTMPQAQNIVSLKPRHSQPKNYGSTAMAVLRHKVSGKEQPMLRKAAERMAKSNPNFYEVLNK